ncbi:hypothetical protein WME91_31220 [Sorangium sp. So ce269]
MLDYLVEDPKSVRMMMWRQLELPDEAEHDAATAKVHALGAAHDLGVTSRRRS